MGQGGSPARRRARAGPLYLEPLEDRQLLSGIIPPPVSNGMMPAGQGTGASPAAVGSDTLPALNPPPPDGSAVNGGEKYPAAPGSQPASGGAAGATATPYPTTNPNGNPPAGPDTSLTDPTPGDDNSAAGSIGAGQPAANPPYRTAANGPGAVDPSPGSPAQQTYPPVEYSARPYATYQVSGDGTAAAYDLYRVSEARPAALVVSPPAPAGPQPAGAAAPAAQAPAPPPEPPAPPETSRGAAEPVAVARPQQESGSGAAEFGLPLLASVAAEGAPDGVVEGQAEASSPAPPAGDGPSRLAPQLGALLAGALPVDLPALERAADEFFARLGGLAEEMTGSPAGQRLTRWLVTAVAAVGVFEVARRRLRPPAGGDGGHPLWAPFPVLAILPPEDEP